jgi:hypothetical protein
LFFGASLGATVEPTALDFGTLLSLRGASYVPDGYCIFFLSGLRGFAVVRGGGTTCVFLAITLL